MGSEDFHTESACLGHGAAGEIVAAESGRKTEIVLDPGAEPSLAAGRFAFDHDRAEAFAGAINGGSESSGAAADNSEVIEAGLRVRAQADLFGHGGQGRLGEPRAIGKKNQGQRLRFWAQ